MPSYKINKCKFYQGYRKETDRKQFDELEGETLSINYHKLHNSISYVENN